MDLRHIIVGTAGHIDHGKSTLVEALTGTHPDRLEEEKRRGITIDLGFAFLSMDGLRIGFVDVPGHEKFVRNMLAGAGGIDVVLLVVAADESIKPQTREHFEICRLLGIPRGIVVITKADLVEPDVLSLVKLEVEEFVRGGRLPEDVGTDSLAERPAIVPVSARNGTGLDELRSQIARVARETPVRDASRHFRLPIDRSFAMKGFGTVVTGTLVAGTLKIEDEVELYPTGKRLRVRGLHSGGASVERVVAGQRTAVNLAGIDHHEISRGMCLAPPGVFEAANRIDAQITLLASAKNMENRARVHFHQGTAETVAEVVLLEGDELQPGDSAVAQLHLKEKLLLLPGDRFIVRQLSPVVTIGGGVVIDAKPPRHRRNDVSVSSTLEIFASGDRPRILLAIADGSKTGAATAREVVARMGWTDAEIHDAYQSAAEGKLRIVSASQQPLVFASSASVADCAEVIRAAVDRFHRENPLLAGIPRQDLRNRCGRFDENLFVASLNDLVKGRELSVAGDLVQRAGRTTTLAPEEQRARDLIEREFASAGLAVPNLEAVLSGLPVESKRARNILQMLLRDQVLVRVSTDLVFHRSAVARLRELLDGYRKTKGTRLPVPAFKELTGVSRKYAIPLLEYLDREQVTRRVGDERVIL